LQLALHRHLRHSIAPVFLGLNQSLAPRTDSAPDYQMSKIGQLESGLLRFNYCQFGTNLLSWSWLYMWISAIPGLRGPFFRVYTRI